MVVFKSKFFQFSVGWVFFNQNDPERLHVQLIGPPYGPIGRGYGVIQSVAILLRFLYPFFVVLVD